MDKLDTTKKILSKALNLEKHFNVALAKELIEIKDSLESMAKMTFPEMKDNTDKLDLILNKLNEENDSEEITVTLNIV